METLNDLVILFLEKIKIDLSEPEQAFHQCKKVSIMLVQFLQSNNIDADLIKVGHFLSGGFKSAYIKWTEIDKFLWSHYLVRVGDVYVDITWNQFVPGTPIPIYFTEVDVMGQWEYYYVV